MRFAAAKLITGEPMDPRDRNLGEGIWASMLLPRGTTLEEMDGAGRWQDFASDSRKQLRTQKELEVAQQAAIEAQLQARKAKEIAQG